MKGYQGEIIASRWSRRQGPSLTGSLVQHHRLTPVSSLAPNINLLVSTKVAIFEQTISAVHDKDVPRQPRPSPLLAVKSHVSRVISILVYSVSVFYYY